MSRRAVDYVSMSALRATLATAVMVALLAPTAAGCGGGSARTATASTESRAVQPSNVPAFHAERNARQAVTVRSCLAHPSGAWSMAGSIANHSSESASYTMVVDFVTVPGSTVVHTSVVRVHRLEPGKTAQWVASGGHASQRLTCVLRYAQAG